MFMSVLVAITSFYRTFSASFTRHHSIHFEVEKRKKKKIKFAKKKTIQFRLIQITIFQPKKKKLSHFIAKCAILSFERHTLLLDVKFYLL